MQVSESHPLRAHEPVAEHVVGVTPHCNHPVTRNGDLQAARGLAQWADA